jgi:hypothetical protein
VTPLEIAIRRVGSGSGSSGSDRISLIKKIIESRIGFESIRFGSSQVGFWLKHCRVFSGFGSIQVEPDRVSGHSGPGRVGFQIIWYRVISDFRLFWVGLGRVGSGSFLWCFISGRVLFCDVLFRVGSNFGSDWISSRQDVSNYQIILITAMFVIIAALYFACCWRCNFSFWHLL